MQLKAGDSGVFNTKELTQKFQKMKELKAERQKIYDAQDEATKDQADLIHERDVLNKKIDRTFNKEEMIAKGIKEAEKKLNTANSSKKNVE